MKYRYSGFNKLVSVSPELKEFLNLKEENQYTLDLRTCSVINEVTRYVTRISAMKLCEYLVNNPHVQREYDVTVTQIA